VIFKVKSASVLGSV